MICSLKRLTPRRLAALLCFLSMASPLAEDVGERWGTAASERLHYRIVDVPIPENIVIEAGAFETLPDGRIAVATRYGDIYFISGIDEPNPQPRFHLFATGLDEIFGLAYRDGAFYVTQSGELTKITDTDGDGRADRFDTISDVWGYGNYHEYAFGSKFDAAGNLYVALGLSSSYHSRELFRGWGFKITPQGESIPIASGMRSPGGIGFNEHGSLFYVESQGPWNSANSLKHVREGGFMGHPISYNWYPYAPNMSPAPTEPSPGSTFQHVRETIPQFVPYAVIFPYIRMGRSITGFVVDQTHGAFGPFNNQIFLGDYTQSLVMRATTEQVNGVWQGACYPFREELSTGILNVHFTPAGNLLCGGTNRGWPVRGRKPFALERIEWTGRVPFEIERVSITTDGFRIHFTRPVDPVSASAPDTYEINTFTHRYHGAYGGPEIEQTTPLVFAVELSPDHRSAALHVDGVLRNHVHEFNLRHLRSQDGASLVHNHAYYTVNEIPNQPSTSQP